MNMPVEQAIPVLKRGLQDVVPFAETAGVNILVEALASKMTNVINTLQEAQEFTSGIGSPSISSMFDFHNCVDEEKSWHQLVKNILTLFSMSI